MLVDHAAFKAAVTSLLVIVFYRWFSPLFLNLFRRWMTIPYLEITFPARDVYGAVRLVAAALLQALFFFVMSWVFRPPISSFFPAGFDGLILALSIVLGIGEMAVATLLGYSVMQAVALADTIARRTSPDWRPIARGGWIQMYFKTIQVLPAPFGLASVFGYIAFEECIFRIIVTGTLAAESPYVAVTISTILFVIYQQFHTPSWRTAVFPMLGATVVGLVHGTIYLFVPNIGPLIIAHCSFFAAALWSVRAISTVGERSAVGRAD
jgi:Type II CAAX prenyl endopeptidase Rce1-like